MPINFPLSPSVNQTYTYNGRTWIYNGNAWSVANTYSSNVATTQYVDTAVASVQALPGGSNTQVQFNDAGVFAGNANLTYAKTTGTLTAKILKADTILKVDTIQDLANTTSISVATLTTAKTAHANFYYAVNQDAGSLTISGTGGTGLKMAFNKIDSNVNISPNVTNSTWTHAFTGRYVIRCQYRQDSGGDVWTVHAVTKDGDTFAVGIGARTGSGNGTIPMLFEVYYTVDSTTATYQLQHYSTTAKAVTSSFNTGTPTWTNYSTLTGGVTGTHTGRMVNYVVYRVGD